MWLKSHWKIAAKAISCASVALLLFWAITLHNDNKKLSERLEMAQNNIEAYQDALSGSWWASNVLKLDMKTLSEQNDSLMQELDKVRKDLGIKSKELTTAATQTQVINVNTSKGVRGDIIEILKDTVYTDSVKVNLDIQNSQYLYIYKHKEYKNKKSFIKRLLTFDWKKTTRYKYNIVNTNDAIQTNGVRVIETIN